MSPLQLTWLLALEALLPAQDWHAVLMHLLLQQAPLLASRNIVQQQHGALHQSEIECRGSISCNKPYGSTIS